MAVYQSSGELFGRHDYNAQMTERYASFSVNGGEAQRVVFRNSYSDETFNSQIVPVTLQNRRNDNPDKTAIQRLLQILPRAERM